jgi:hypothetical protein
VLWLEDGLAAGAAHGAATERAALAQQRAGTPDPLTIEQAASMLAGRVRSLVAP